MLHEFRRIICTVCGQVLDIPVYCGDRFCPVCSVSRSIRTRSRMQWLVDHQPKLHAHAFYFWTFSLKNCQDLPKGIAQLQKSFRKLRSRQYWKTHVEGGAFVIEIKGRPGDWHPHIHVIVYSTYMK